MIESFMKKLPAAMVKSLDKMKGSMLISMAKGMAPNDAAAMARHWGYVPVNTPQKVVSVVEKQMKEDLTQTVIPDRPLTDDMKAVLRSMHLKTESQAPPENKAKKEVEDIADRSLDKALPATNLIVQKGSDGVKTIPSGGTSIATMAEDLSEVNAISEELIHPVFGRKIVDLGYKTVYLTSVSLLARTQVWERQRTLRPDRAARIASSKIALGRTKSLSGVITMFRDSLTGQSGIVDGQHRAGALLMLSQQGHWDGLENNILIDVFETKNDEEIVALFKEINSAEPVRLVDMPGEVGIGCCSPFYVCNSFIHLCPTYIFLTGCVSRREGHPRLYYRRLVFKIL